jgi:hypothetical protein
MSSSSGMLLRTLAMQQQLVLLPALQHLQTVTAC